MSVNVRCANCNIVVPKDQTYMVNFLNICVNCYGLDVNNEDREEDYDKWEDEEYVDDEDYWEEWEDIDEEDW